jgi:hypothetical protein
MTTFIFGPRPLFLAMANWLPAITDDGAAMHWSKRALLVALAIAFMVPDMPQACAQDRQSLAYGAGSVDPRFGSPNAIFNGPDPVPLPKSNPGNFSGTTADFMKSFSDNSQPATQSAAPRVAKKKPVKKSRSSGWMIPPPPSIGLVPPPPPTVPIPGAMLTVPPPPISMPSPYSGKDLKDMGPGAVHAAMLPYTEGASSYRPSPPPSYQRPRSINEQYAEVRTIKVKRRKRLIVNR